MPSCTRHLAGRKRRWSGLPEGMSRQPVGGVGPRDLLGGAVRGRDDHLAARRRLPERLQSRRTDVIESPLVEDQIEGSMFFATPRREPLRHAAGALPGREGSRARHPRQGRRQGRLRPRDRPADDARSTTCRSCPTRTSTSASAKASAARWPRPRTAAIYTTEVETSPWLDPTTVLHQSSPFSLTAGARRRPVPAGRWRRSAPGAVAGHAQRQRDLVLAVLPAPDPDRRRAGDHLLLGRACRRACSARSPASRTAPRT